MKSADSSFFRQTHYQLGRVFLILGVVLLFFSYPPAWLQGLVNLPFHLSVPGFMLLALLAVPLILAARWRLPWPLMAAGGVFLLMLVINALRFPERLVPALELLGYISIPLAAALLLRDKRLLNFNRLVWVAFVLWCCQLLFGAIALCRRGPVVGFAGNTNWMAGLLLSLCPWVFCAWRRLLNRLKMSERQRFALALALTALPTLILLYFCRSRGAWLALLAVGAVFIFLRLRSRLEKGLFAVLVIVFFMTVFTVLLGFAPGRLIKTVQADVRLPLWSSTVGMIARHPFGVGAGQFRKRFTPFRARSTYHTRLVAAPTTIHPHNELLNVAALLGVPAALAFLVLLVPLVQQNSAGPLQTCARFSAVALVVHGMFDMVLVQPPTNIIGFFCLGLCWPVRAAPETAASPWTFQARRAAVPLAILGAILLGVGLTFGDLRLDAALRRGTIASRIASEYVKRGNRQAATASFEVAYACFKRAAKLQPKHIGAHYQAARMALVCLNRPDDAERHLNTVKNLDPNFAHINSLFARLKVFQKKFGEAYGYFQAECVLYPHSTAAWQDMFNFNLGTGQYHKLAEIDESLTKLYRERAALNYPGKRLGRKLKEWRQAISANDPKLALAHARELTSKIETRFLDPLLLELTGGKGPFSAEMLNLGYNDLDFHYWRQELAHRKLLLAAGSDVFPVAIPELTAWFGKNAAIAPQLDTFQLPVAFWPRRAGSPLSAYVMYSALVAANGGYCVLRLDEQEVPQTALVYHGRNRYRVNLQKKSCQKLTAAEAADEAAWTPGRTVVYFPCEKFYLRTQVLAALPGAGFLPARPPSLELIALFLLSGHQPPPLAKLKDYCLKAPFELYSKRYRQVIKSQKR